MRYLTVGEIVRINEAEAGPNNLVDFGLLESAVLRPQQTVGSQDAYPDIYEKAAALMHSVVRNHPFLDGNKRTAAASMIVFLRLNGYGFHATQDELVAITTDAAEGLIDTAKIAAALKGWSFDEIDLLPEDHQ